MSHPLCPFSECLACRRRGHLAEQDTLRAPETKVFLVRICFPVRCSGDIHSLQAIANYVCASDLAGQGNCWQIGHNKLVAEAKAGDGSVRGSSKAICHPGEESYLHPEMLDLVWDQSIQGNCKRQRICFHHRELFVSGEGHPDSVRVYYRKRQCDWRLKAQGFGKRWREMIKGLYGSACPWTFTDFPHQFDKGKTLQ